MRWGRGGEAEAGLLRERVHRIADRLTNNADRDVLLEVLRRAYERDGLLAAVAELRQRLHYLEEGRAP